MRIPTQNGRRGSAVILSVRRVDDLVLRSGAGNWDSTGERLQLVVMRVALINSGLGLLGAAAAVRRLRPGTDLVLAMDPDGMPWGPRRPDDIAAAFPGCCARAAAVYRPDVLVFACNTGSVHALDVLREEFEPALPVVGTVPAVEGPARPGSTVAIWATAATTGSPYQHGLIAQFAAHVPVTEVACHGLADAVHAGDHAAIDRAVSAASALTPPGIRAVVLGCTEYELAADRIAAAVPGGGAVRFGGGGGHPGPAPRRHRGERGGRLPRTGPGGLTVLGTQWRASQELPEAALRYPEGRLLAGNPRRRRAGSALA